MGGEFSTINGVPKAYLARLHGDSDVGPGWILFDPPAHEIFEDAGSITLTVRRVGGSEGDVTASYRTDNGSAVAGADYQGQSGDLIFHDGETEKDITISIHDDTEIEDLESFRVVLSDPTGGAKLGITSVATVNIQDDDGPASMDSTFVVSPDSLDGAVESIAVQKDGKILLGGAFLQAGRVSRIGMARLKTDGSLDETFDPGMGLSLNGTHGDAKLMKVQQDGRILVAGLFNSVNGTNRNHIARLNEDGSLDETFDAGTGARDGASVADIRWFDLLPDGRIIVAGGFTTFDEISRNGLALLHTNGPVVQSYNPAGGPSIMPFGLQADGKVVYSGLWENRVSRINADGSMDSPNFTTTDGSIWKIQSLSNSNTIIAGLFTAVDGQPLQAIARLLPDGEVDPEFVPDMSVFRSGFSSPYIYLFAPQDDGKVLVALKSYRSPSGNYVARLNENGALDTGFEPVRFAIPGGDNDSIAALAIQQDGRILVGGIFQTVNGLKHPYLVRLRGGGTSGTRRLAVKSLSLSTNQTEITLTVAPGQPFVLESSTDLVHWIPLSTNVSPVSTFAVLDNQLTSVPRRYYRAIQSAP